MEQNKEFVNLYERIVALETKLNEVCRVVQKLETQFNGYLTTKIRTEVKAMLAEIMFVVITSSAFISFLISKLFK